MQHPQQNTKVQRKTTSASLTSIKVENVAHMPKTKE